MITKPLFRKNYFIFVSIILISLFIAFVSVELFRRYQMQGQQMVPKNHANFFKNIFEQLDPNPRTALQRLRQAMGNEPFVQFDLIDRSGKSFTTNQQVIPPLNADQLDTLAAGRTYRVSPDEFGPPLLEVSQTKFDNTYFISRFTPPPQLATGPHAKVPPIKGPGGIPAEYAGPPPPPSTGPSKSGTMAARGRGPGIGPGPGHGPPPAFLWITILSLVACTLISVGVALIYQFSKYRERAEEALRVLNELEHGNLSARMPVRKFDELAPLVVAFNHMATDLERMVENLRKADHARRQLLQDLAHDLRTPLTSLKTFLETLKSADARLSQEKRYEVLTLCSTEVEYFGKLVEDLLFLAQITEPKYSAGTEEIQLLDRVQEQITVFKTRYPNLKYEIEVPSGAELKPVAGSAKLIDRLLRNAFENSSSFASSKVRIEIHPQNDLLKVNILDDGPGFSQSALKEFGYKKASRVLSGDSDNKRISVGIGSVIMREILQLHSGELRADNIHNGETVVGGIVSFSLPLT